SHADGRRIRDVEDAGTDMDVVVARLDLPTALPVFEVAAANRDTCRHRGTGVGPHHGVSDEPTGRSIHHGLGARGIHLHHVFSATCAGVADGTLHDRGPVGVEVRNGHIRDGPCRVAESVTELV